MELLKTLKNQRIIVDPGVANMQVSNLVSSIKSAYKIKKIIKQLKKFLLLKTHVKKVH